MVKYFCDRCNKELDDTDRMRARDIRVGHIIKLSLVCEACLLSLGRWMNEAALTPLDESEEEAHPIPRHYTMRRYRVALVPSYPRHPWFDKGMRSKAKEE